MISLFRSHCQSKVLHRVGSVRGGTSRRYCETIRAWRPCARYGDTTQEYETKFITDQTAAKDEESSSDSRRVQPRTVKKEKEESKSEKQKEKTNSDGCARGVFQKISRKEERTKKQASEMHKNKRKKERNEGSRNGIQGLYSLYERIQTE